MKIIKIGEILSLSVPDQVVCEKSDDEFITLTFGGPQKPRLYLFSEIKGDLIHWCERILEDQIKNVIGAPFSSTVESIAGDTWLGLQGVTMLDESNALINRVIASKVSDYGARIEFSVMRGVIPEEVVETIDNVTFERVMPSE